MRTTWEQWEDTERHPGRFEGKGSQKLAARLYELSLDGCNEEELGDVADFGWYALITDEDGELGLPEPAFIVSEGNQGFFSYAAYETDYAALKAWHELEKEYNEFVKQEGE